MWQWWALALRCYALVSSKQRLLRHAYAARGWGCRGCVCAGVHWHCQGTQPHSTRFTTRAFHSNLICISCILVEGGRDISELCCLTRCRCCATARCRQRLATRWPRASRLLEMSCFGSSLTAWRCPLGPLFLSSYPPLSLPPLARCPSSQVCPPLAVSGPPS